MKSEKWVKVLACPCEGMDVLQFVGQILSTIVPVSATIPTRILSAQLNTHTNIHIHMITNIYFSRTNIHETIHTETNNWTIYLLFFTHKTCQKENIHEEQLNVDSVLIIYNINNNSSKHHVDIFWCSSWFVDCVAIEWNWLMWGERQTCGMKMLPLARPNPPSNTYTHIFIHP